MAQFFFERGRMLIAPKYCLSCCINVLPPFKAEGLFSNEVIINYTLEEIHDFPRVIQHIFRLFYQLLSLVLFHPPSSQSKIDAGALRCQ